LPGGLPEPGAIIKHANGIVDFNQDHCIGCGYCITGCPFNIPRISQKDTRPTSAPCVPTAWRGLEPACVKTCPTGAIVFGTKEDMKEHAAERIVDLKSRGFDNAGLYDPEASAAPT
jgi:formate dehydrogenase iron-sulfur subunit